MRSTTLATPALCWFGIMLAAAVASAQCVAPPEWFPHSKTQEPDFHAPRNECEFHQWAWQEFLFLTQEVNGRPCFLLVNGLLRRMELEALQASAK